VAVAMALVYALSVSPGAHALVISMGVPEPNAPPPGNAPQLLAPQPLTPVGIPKVSADGPLEFKLDVAPTAQGVLAKRKISETGSWVQPVLRITSPIGTKSLSIRFVGSAELIERVDIPDGTKNLLVPGPLAEKGSVRVFIVGPQQNSGTLATIEPSGIPVLPPTKPLGVFSAGDKLSLMSKINDSEMRNLARNVASLIFQQSDRLTYACTGFLLSTPGSNMLLTNRHCVVDARACPSMVMMFDYLYPGLQGASFRRCKRIVTTDEKSAPGLDYAVLELDSPMSGISGLPLASEPPDKVSDVAIVQHPNGEQQQLAMCFDDPDCKCFVGDINVTGYRVAADATHRCDTKGGSSGAPVMTILEGSVVGLHHITLSTRNQAVMTYLIREDLGRKCDAGPAAECVSLQE